MDRAEGQLVSHPGIASFRALIVAGLTLLLAGCAPSSAITPSASQSAGPSPTPSPVVTTPSPTVASSAAHGAWIGLDWQAPVELAPYESVFDAVAWGGGYVAVGQFQNTPQSRGQAAAWFSADWHSW